tara:strand:- start:3982 stop:4170 length:189 start_codon:yes stop_codon:yes gene_type:complete
MNDTIEYVIKTEKGFLAFQGDRAWFQDSISGWVVVSSDIENLKLIASHFLNGETFEIKKQRP